MLLYSGLFKYSLPKLFRLKMTLILSSEISSKFHSMYMDIVSLSINMFNKKYFNKLEIKKRVCFDLSQSKKIM